jgi:NAD(P)-dependent dehydrogenase (short-subunit alcohol dehydrogenase family)
MASRNFTSASAAAAAIRESAPSALVTAAKLDLADLGSVRAFSQEFLATSGGLDLLVNNAGVMAVPYQRTADGFELHLGVNHLGHFALTGLMLPGLRERPGARVVTVSSILHKLGRIHFDDLQSERRYGRWAAYNQSKLANLMFALELDRRLKAASLPVISLAAHPGYSATPLWLRATPWYVRTPLRLMNPFIAQSGERGALPTLYAATVSGLPGGSYIGPDGPGESRGYPSLVKPSRHAQSKDAAVRLWRISEQLTGVTYDLTGEADD